LTDLGTLGGGASWAYGINDCGQVVGTSCIADGSRRAFLYSDGTMINLGTLGGDSSEGYGINDCGQITGGAQVMAGEIHVFLYDKGAMTDLGFEGVGRSINNGGQITGKTRNAIDGSYGGGAFIYHTDIQSGMIISHDGIGYGINDSGQVAGWDGLDCAVLYSSGGIINLCYGIGYAINISGQVTGEAYDAITPYSKAFLYHAGTMIDLGMVGVNSSAGYGINDGGQVVGWAQTAGGEAFAFLYGDGEMSDLNSLIDASCGWTLISGRDVNNLGQIVGYGINPQGAEHAFLLTPIPEPATILLFGLAGVMANRKKVKENMVSSLPKLAAGEEAGSGEFGRRF